MTYAELEQKLKELDTKANRDAYMKTQDKFLFAVDTIREHFDAKLSLNSDLTDELADTMMNIWEKV